MSEESIEKQLSEIANNISDNDIEETYKRSEAFALIPVLKLIYHTIKIDYGKHFKLKVPLSSNKASEIPVGEIEITNNNYKYKIYLDLVKNDYDLNKMLIENNILSNNINNLMDETNEEKKQQIINIITFLIHSAKLIFESIKSKYSEINNIDINLDNNTTIYFNPDAELRLAVVIKKEDV